MARPTPGSDAAAWIALVIGVVCLVLFPILMVRRPNPLVPLELFRSRAFATVNLATFFIYGALYVTFFYQAVILQGVLGYTALGAGIVGIPSGIMLTLLSTRVGVAGRTTGLAAVPRRRPAADGNRPAVVFADPRRFGRPGGPPSMTRATLVPPIDVFIDILPFSLLFGLGISFVVAPLTSTLMGSISGRFSGLGSAINNSISRVGQPLLGALIFIVISATYYASLGSTAGLDTTDPNVRRAFQPLNPPAAGASPAEITASNQASLDAFHLAMLICAGLLVVGAAVSWFGLRERRSAPAVVAARGATADPPAPTG